MNNKQVLFGILVIGDEILSGRRKDKHLEKSIEILTRHGQSLAWVRYAGDDEYMLSQHFREIRNLDHHCFSFGGIGATIDDRTRQSIATAFNRKILRHPDAVKEIESEFGKQAYPNRILMADLPEGAQIIPNPYNRVPGFSVENIHCLPGFPVMAWPMMEWLMQEKYQHLSRKDLTLVTLTLMNAHESELISLLEEFQQQYPAIKISSLPTFLDTWPEKNRAWHARAGKRDKPCMQVNQKQVN